MKKRINITLSEEALLIADESGNRSEFIENLIITEGSGSPATLAEIKELLDTYPGLKNIASPTANLLDIPGVTTADKLNELTYEDF